MGIEELRRCLMGLVRVGRVMDLNRSQRMARVKFDSEGFTSGWLYVLQNSGAGVEIQPDARHNHPIQDTYTGGGSSGEFAEHNHPGSRVTEWMPRINDVVLCLYLPTQDGAGDGYILGGR